MRMLILGLMILIVSWGVAKANDDPKIAEELKALAGNYTVKKWNINNTQSWSTASGKYQATITGNEMVVTYMGKVRNKSILKVDPTTTPKQVILTRTEDNQTYTEHGIYEQQKDGTVAIAVGDNNPDNRPKEFKIGRGRTFIILERNK